MYLEKAPVRRYSQIADGIHLLALHSERISRSVRPGQFVNVKVDDSNDPFLRRAYSVHRVDGDEFELAFNVVGRGSAILAARRPGDLVDVLGPLGVPFHLDSVFERALLVSGGVGIAPMPILSAALEEMGIEVANVHGARTRGLLVRDGRLVNAVYATDDGSFGYHGTVVGAAMDRLDDWPPDGTRVFACGPNAMLQALGDTVTARGVRIEVSLECQMACGIGICQGCPVETVGAERRFSLVCTHGPNYDFRDVRLESLPNLH